METSMRRETDSGMRLTSEARAVDGGASAWAVWGRTSRATLRLSHSYSLSARSFHLPFCAVTWTNRWRKETTTSSESNSVQTSAFRYFLVHVKKSRLCPPSRKRKDKPACSLLL